MSDGGHWIHNPDPSKLTHRTIPFPDFDPDGDFQVGLTVHQWARDYFERIAGE